MPESKEVVVVDLAKFGIDKEENFKQLELTHSQQIVAAFTPFLLKLERAEIECEKIRVAAKGGVTPEIVAMAKRTRIDISKIRTGAKNKKDAAKKPVLIKGRAIDGVYNIIVGATTPLEDALGKIEKAAEIAKKKELAALQEKRALELSDYMPYEDANARNLSALEEDVFEALKTAKKKTFEDAEAEKTRIEEERIEKERKDEVEKARRDLLMPLSAFATAQELSWFADLSDEDFSVLFNDLKDRLDDHEEKIAEQAAENKRLKDAADLKEKEDAKAAKVEKAANAEASRRQVLFAKIGKTILFATCKAMSEEKFNANYTKLKADFDKEAKAESARKEKEDAARQKEKTRLRNLEIDAANKAETDRIAAEDAEFNRQAELAKGDGQKMLDFVNAIQELADRECNFTSKKYIKIKVAARIQLNNVISKIIEASK